MAKTTEQALEELTDPMDFKAGSLVDGEEDLTNDKAEEAEGADNSDEGDEDLIKEDGEEIPEEEADGDLIDETEDGEKPLLALSEEAKAGMTPEAIKRYENHVKGVAKRETDLTTRVKDVEEREEKLKEREPLFESYSKLDKAVSDKKTYPDALKFIANIAKDHGLDVAEILGIKQGEGEEEVEFESDKKLLGKVEEMTAKAKADAVKEALAAMGVDPKDLAALVADKKSSATREAKTAAIDEVMTPLLNTLRVKDGGWKPDKDAVKKVLLEGDWTMPKEALELVRNKLRKERDSHMSATKRERGPEQLPTGKTPGKPLPKNPLDAKASDILGYKD